MKNKRLDTVLLVVIVILLAVIVVYLVKNNSVKSSSPIPTPNTPQIPETPSPKSPETPNVPDKTQTTPSNNQHGPTSVGGIEDAFYSFSNQYSFKYKDFKDAEKAFKSMTNIAMNVTDVNLYVPGKVPHEDGNPYFIGRGIIDQANNKCIVGYMNLVTGQAKSWTDVCVIYN